MAQDASLGAIHGRVFDPAGLPVATANVSLRRPTRGLEFHVAANDDGSFAFGLLEPGEYELTAEASGMSARVVRNIRVEVGAIADVELHLSLARTREQVTVVESPQLVETQSSEIAQVIDSVAIDNLPLNGRRFTDLALLGAGVTPDPRGLTSSSNGDLAFGGIRGFQSTMLVDGGDNNNAFFAQARGRYRAPYQFSNEVVQEFRVSSNTYGAELGRAGGAVINVVTRSGANHVHGTGFYYLRDSSFNATPDYVGFKPQDRQHQFGGTLSGPIKKNRAFFFAGFDQHIFEVPTVVYFLNGYPVLMPTVNDFEYSDYGLVMATAAALSTMGGEFRSRLLRNAAFGKVDVAITPRQHLSARVNTSRYYGS